MDSRIVQNLLAGLVFASVFTPSAMAGVVTSGTVIGASDSACCGLTADKLVDQSGLSFNY